MLSLQLKAPFYGLIKRPSDPDEKKGVITDTALINVAQTSLKNYGALALYKGAGRMQADVNEMYNVMASFWSAVRDVFPEA